MHLHARSGAIPAIRQFRLLPLLLGLSLAAQSPPSSTPAIGGVLWGVAYPNDQLMYVDPLAATANSTLLTGNYLMSTGPHSSIQPSPHALTWDARRNLLWSGNENTAELTTIDPWTRRVTAYPVGIHVGALTHDRDEDRLYVISYHNGVDYVVRQLDPSQSPPAVVWNADVPTGATEGLAFDSGSQELYGVDRSSLYRISLTPGSRGARQPIAVTPSDFWSITYDPHGDRLLACDSQSNLYAVTVSGNTAAASLLGSGHANLSGLAFQSCRPVVALASASPSPTSTMPMMLTGRDFEPGAGVWFDGVELHARYVQWRATDRIDVTAPQLGAGAHQVVVRNPPTTRCTFSMDSAPLPIMSCPVAPTITDMPVRNAPVAGGVVRTILGQDFHAPCEVRFGGVPAPSVVVVNSGELAVTVPAAAAPGPVAVEVTNLTPATMTCPAQLSLPWSGFFYADAPSISAVSPAAGGLCGGTRVTITGANFSAPASATTVWFGSVAGANVEVVNAATIRVDTPPAAPLIAVTVDVTVDTGTAPAATLPAAQGYRYEVRTPSFDPVTPLSPARGSPFGGESVTIRGQDFGPRARVFFGDDEALVQWIDATELRVTTPVSTAHNGTTSFSVDVRVVNCDGRGARRCQFDFAIDPSDIRTVDPRPGNAEFQSIQAAIQAASDGQAVLVNPGLYFESLDTLGKRLLVAGTNTAGAGRPRISPSAGGPVLRIGSGETGATVVANLSLVSGTQGVLIEHGAAPCLLDNDIHNSDVGILVRSGAAPRLIDNEVNQNFRYGVRIEATAGAAVLRGNEIYTNGTPGVDGAGLYLASDCPVEVVHGNWIHGNRAGGAWIGRGPTGRVFSANTFDNNTREGAGAAVCIEPFASVTFVSTAFRDNVSGTDGGAIACDATDAAAGLTTIVLDGCLVLGNRAEGRCGQGGGLYLRGSEDPFHQVTCRMLRCRIHRNTAQLGGAAALQAKVDATLWRCEVACNSAQVLYAPAAEAVCGTPYQAANATAPAAYAPGLLVRDAWVRSINSVYSGNTGNTGVSPHGAAVHALTGPLNDSRLVNNIFTNHGDHALMLQGASSSLPLRNNWFFANAAGDVIGPPAPTWQPGAPPAMTDPLFAGDTSSAALANNAPSSIAAPSPFALTAASPCIDRGYVGPEVAAPYGVVPAGGNGAMDIGAHERGAEMIRIFGVSTPHGCGTPQISASANPLLGSTSTLTGADLVPDNVLVAMLLQVSSLNAPEVSVGLPAGLPGHLYVPNPLTTVLIPSDSLGVARYPLSIPNDPALADTILRGQILDFDAANGRLGGTQAIRLWVRQS